MHDCGLGLQGSQKNVARQGTNHPDFSLHRAFMGLIFSFLMRLSGHRGVSILAQPLAWAVT